MSYIPLPNSYRPNTPGFLQTRITCDCCGRVRTYGEALEAGWTYDPQGQAFVAFRCSICTALHDAAPSVSRYVFNTPCPHCKQELAVDTTVIYNIETYKNARLAKALCCGKGVVVHPVLTFRAEAFHGSRTADDWGRLFTTSPRPQA